MLSDGIGTVVAEVLRLERVSRMTTSTWSAATGLA
jgi:hypothetical protein